MSVSKIVSTIAVAGTLCCIATSFTRGVEGQTEVASDKKVETVLTLPAPGNTENIGQDHDGSFYITGLNDRILWKVTQTGQIDKLFTEPTATAFLGVATDKHEIVLVVYQKPFRRPAPAGGAPGGLDLSHVGGQILILDKTGNVKATIEGQDGQAFNGVARAGKSSYLIADHNGTEILHLDTAKKKIEVWMNDPLLAQPNGIKVYQNWVYVSCGMKLYKVQIGSHGKPKGSPELFAQDINADDFAFAPDGTMYVPTGMKMMKVSPAGEISLFLDNVPNGPSAWVTKDGRWLYWTTRAGPGRLLRVALN